MYESIFENCSLTNHVQYIFATPQRVVVVDADAVECFTIFCYLPSPSSFHQQLPLLKYQIPHTHTHKINTNTKGVNLFVVVVFALLRIIKQIISILFFISGITRKKDEKDLIVIH